jgi:hypothetical protein
MWLLRGVGASIPSVLAELSVPDESDADELLLRSGGESGLGAAAFFGGRAPCLAEGT